MNRAVILLSGGLDSVVSLAVLKNNYDEILALTFDYLQKSAFQEIKSAKKISQFYSIKHKVIKLDWLGEISTSSLNSENEIPNIKENELNNIEITKDSMKSVWVPNRNALFVNIAACFAETIGAKDIIIGANKEEGETFIDNSIQFVNSINETLKYSVNSEIGLQAPLINMTKIDIVKKALELNIPFNFLYSCYNGDSKHCLKCESCTRLLRALKELNRNDIIEIIKG